ncbi:MAG: hypothetical protein IPH86_11165 [bacterium]|nr:hypothetical protein [bacterium]
MDSAQIESMLGDFRRNVNIIQATGIGQLFGPAHFPSFLGKSLALMCAAPRANRTARCPVTCRRSRARPR